MGCFLLAGRLAAQEGAPALEFSFSNPGARSLGFGGAFVALADDATAAFANPAGLVQLARPEVSIEGRLWSYETEFLAGGRAADPPTGIGIDTDPGLRRGVSADDLSGLSFLSFVYPKNRWAIALYRHQAANFEATSRIEGLFRGRPELGLPARDDMRTLTDLEVVSHGLTGAYRFNDRFSAGIGVASSAADFTARTDDFRSPDDFGRGDFRPENVDDVRLLTVDDAGLSLVAGFLWQPARQWTVGGVFRAGPTVEVEAAFIAGPVNDEGGAPGEVLASQSSEVELPDVFGLGIARRSRGGAVTLSFEWDRVRYSTLLRGSGTRTAIDDADELHFGFEYAWLRRNPVVALRLGVWRDPDHGIRALPEASAFTRAAFQGGRSEIHLAAGAGVAFRNFQLDFGVDVSRPVDVAALSAIYSF